MSIVITIIATISVFLLNGCAGTTPIKSLALPPVRSIEGKITQLDESGFTLMDSSGSIYVRAELSENRKLNLSIDEKVKVYGNLLSCQKKIFDGYVIKKSTGEQIIVSYPTPHFGFIIQGSLSSDQQSAVSAKFTWKIQSVFNDNFVCLQLQNRRCSSQG